MPAVIVEPTARQRIYITGMPGCGKSTLGKKMARYLAWTFIDLDQLIASKEQRPVQTIFDQDGEAGFRQAEVRALHETAGYNQVVIACGGGTPAYQNNMSWMNDHGLSIYLHGSVNTIYNRITHAKSVRPLFKDLDNDALKKKISLLLAQRTPFYTRAHLQVELPVKSAETLTKQALSALQQIC